MQPQTHVLALGFFLVLSGCDTQQQSQESLPSTISSQEVSALDDALTQVLRAQKITGIPSNAGGLPNIAEPKAQLGMKLFFSTALSGNKEVACATCHHPLLGGGDNLSLSIGVNATQIELLGHKRELVEGKMLSVPRNAPSTFNIGLWQTSLFHDGRIQTQKGGITTPDVVFPTIDKNAGSNLVHAQARFPVTSTAEMRGEQFDRNGNTQSCRTLLAARLGGYAKGVDPLPKTVSNAWLAAFREVYQQPNASAAHLITEQNISELLAEYQRSQVFINTPWKTYLEGNKSAISETAKQGALLFFNPLEKQGFNCVRCHSGNFFTDEQFHNTLIPAIGPGKNKENNANGKDYGRWLVTHNDADKFRFRTPTLLNVTVTGPWGHNGSYTSLSSMVRHMLNPYQATLHYDSAQLKQPHIQTQQLQTTTREMLQGNADLVGQNYTEEHVQQLVAFLQTLTDPCVITETCMQPWIPTPDPTAQQNLMQLNAKLN